MREAVLKHPNLVKYVEAMEAELFQCPEGVVRDVPLFTRSGVLTPTSEPPPTS